jgi:hypothetical protein
MGTDIRKVPLTWQHPRKENGEYVELRKRTPPLPKGKEPFGFMFYSSISDTPLSDQIFTDRREMKKWWIYAGRALEADDQNWNAINSADLIEKKIDAWFNREGVPAFEGDPISQDEMPRCIVLDGQDRQTYAKARQKYKDGHGPSDEDLDAMFEMFDEWLMSEEGA